MTLKRSGRRSSRRQQLRDATVSQWGNSLGLRIPRDAAEHLQLKAGEKVTLEVGDDSITIRRLRGRRKWTLEDLLKGVNRKSAGGEFNWGAAVGKERL